MSLLKDVLGMFACPMSLVYFIKWRVSKNGMLGVLKKMTCLAAS